MNKSDGSERYFIDVSKIDAEIVMLEKYAADLRKELQRKLYYRAMILQYQVKKEADTNHSDQQYA